MRETLTVGVLEDWNEFPRFDAWEKLLPQIDPFHFGSRYRFQVEVFRLPDLVATGKAGLGAFLQNLDVLVANWDVANGDPAFGSHLAVDWLDHRRPEILNWVRSGKVLIIEGQAMMSVPSQRAYDSLVGSGELPCCGPEDPQDPLKQENRTGRKCVLTGRAPMKEGFEMLHKELESRLPPGSLTGKELFPGDLGLLNPHINHVDWSRTLYRGWFRRTLLPRSCLPWVSIIRTADRGWLKNQSTMQVATVGQNDRGAIFATTMFLASVDQRHLIVAMMNCARGNTGHLPKRRSLLSRLQKPWEGIVSIVAGACATYFLSRNDGIRQSVTGPLEQLFGEEADGILRAVFTLVLVLIGGALGTWFGFKG